MSLTSYWHNTRTTKPKSAWFDYDRNAVHWQPTRISKGGQIMDTQGWVACAMYRDFPEVKFLDGVTDKVGHDVTCKDCITACRHRGQLFKRMT